MIRNVKKSVWLEQSGEGQREEDKVRKAMWKRVNHVGYFKDLRFYSA